MKKVKALMDVLAKNTEMKVPKKGDKGRIYLALGVIAISCIMIPCCLVVGFISNVMTQALIITGAPTNGLMALIDIMSAFSVVFGMLVIFNILFFSSDREHLIPLPFKSWELMLAKFFYAYFAESVMEFMILISMFVGFFIAYFKEYGFSIISIFTSIIAVAAIPLLPLVYCALIGLLILTVFKNIKNTKIFNYTSTITLAGFILLFLYSFKDIGGINVENYMLSLSSNTNVFSNVLNKIFFTVPVLMKSIENRNILYLILYIIINILVVVVLGLAGKYTYQNALYTVGALGSGKHKYIKEKTSKENSVFSSYLKKEWRVLIRTKAYSGNCVFINLLWPVLFIGYYLVNKDKETFIHLRELFILNYPRTKVLLTLLLTGTAFVASAMNSLASTAFTREGMHLDIIKYIPVPYKLQMSVKFLICIIITYPPLLICEIFSALILKINPAWMLYYALIILACVVFTTCIGMYLDSLHPHSTWDDEYSALRGNLNTFFDMALVMVVAGTVLGGTFLMYNFDAVGEYGFYISIFVMVILLAALTMIFMPKKILNNIENM